MYDPETALRRQDNIEYFHRIAEENTIKHGANDPWTQRMQLISDIYDSLAKCEDDLGNCYDPDEIAILEAKKKELVGIIQEATKRLND